MKLPYLNDVIKLIIISRSYNLYGSSSKGQQIAIKGKFSCIAHIAIQSPIKWWIW